MPAWRDLPLDELRGVAAYVQVLSRAQRREPIAADAASVDAIRATFVASCASCHGEGGEGDGPAAGSLERAPSNFRLQRGSLVHVTDAIANGIPGTSMPPWKNQLAPDEIARLAAYVRTFYAEAH